MLSRGIRRNEGGECGWRNTIRSVVSVDQHKD
jgi:hypothetical protein